MTANTNMNNIVHSPVGGHSGITVASNLVTNGQTVTWNPITSTADYDKLSKRLNTIEERLAILLPNELLQEKYPALKEAYEAYKLIEKIIGEKNETSK